MNRSLKLLALIFIVSQVFSIQALGFSHKEKSENGYSESEEKGVRSTPGLVFKKTSGVAGHKGKDCRAFIQSGA